MPKKPIEQIEYKDKKERMVALKKAAGKINKDLGINAMYFGDEHKGVEKLSCGFQPIDDLLGGGIPYGNFFTIWGGAGVGKTTIAHMLTAQAQREGKLVYYIALEPYDQPRAIKMGVKPDDVLIGQFPQAEQSLDSIVDFSRKKVVDLIILDSIHSLSPKQEQEDKKGEKSLATDTMALLARKLSQFFKVAIDPVKRGNVAVCLIGQSRTDLGGFIPIQKLSGGAALHHYSKGIIKINRGQRANAPSEKVATGKKTSGGNDSYETVAIGFESVLKVEKCQIDGMAKEQTILRLPYYFDSGYFKRVDILSTLKIQSKLTEPLDCPKTGFDEPTSSEPAIAMNSNEPDEVADEKPKKKRGRPSKKTS